MRLTIETDIILINNKIDAVIEVLLEALELMPGFFNSDTKAKEAIVSVYIKKMNAIPKDMIGTKMNGMSLFDIQMLQATIDQLHWKINELNLKVDSFSCRLDSLDEK